MPTLFRMPGIQHNTDIINITNNTNLKNNEVIILRNENNINKFNNNQFNPIINTQKNIINNSVIPSVVKQDIFNLNSNTSLIKNPFLSMLSNSNNSTIKKDTVEIKNKKVIKLIFF